MKKIILCFTTIIISFLFCVRAEAVWVSHSGTGVSGSGGGSFLSGGVLKNTYGVRVTLVDQDGKRLSLKVNGKTYISDSADFYGGYSDVITNAGDNIKNVYHSVCTKSNGQKTYCMRNEVSNGFNLEKGGYKVHKISEIGGWLENFMRNGKTPDNFFKTLENDGTKDISNLKKLFQILMGVSIDDVKNSSGVNCKQNQQKLSKNAYIIYEPITAYNYNKVGTGTEFTIVHQNDKNQKRTIRQLANATYIPTSTGNLGHNYYWAVNKISGTFISDYNLKRTLNLHNGYSIGILKLSDELLKKPPMNCELTDYTVDAACVGCDDDSKESERSSYVIQDTTNWEGIMRSDNSEYVCETDSARKKNLSSYYKKTIDGKTVYCREEIRFVFPNANNTLEVDKGRYFTVHSPFRDEDKLVKNPYDASYSADVKILNENKYDKNWGAITAIKTRECRMSSVSNEQTILENNKSKLMFKKTPQIYLTYKGNDTNGKYNIENLELDSESASEFGSGTKTETTITKNTFQTSDKEITSNYLFKTVQTTTYKLPNTTYRYILKEGAVFTSDKPEEGTYIDLGIATIPVSTKSKTNTDNNPVISLKFKLDSDMQLSKSFVQNNDYLPSCTLKTDTENLNNIYNYAKTKGKVQNNSVTGISDSSKITELANSSCAKLYMCSKTSDGIGNCKKKGVGTCINNRTQNKIGNADNNNCYVKSSNGSSTNNYSCELTVGTGVPGIYVPECPGCAADTSSSTSNSSSKTKTSDSLTPVCQKKITDGVCLPTTGYSTLQYRTIDLSNPFPGQSGSGRYTGLNWCGYNEKTKTWNCSGNSNNEVVNKYIIKNRGVKGSEVYNITPMYTVNLTSDKIKTITAYNDSHNYDDFNLTCNTKGEECISTFVNNYTIKNCQNFGTCDGG